MAVRTRRQYLCDLAENCATNTTIEQSGVTGIVGTLIRICTCIRTYIRKYNVQMYCIGIGTGALR